MLGEITHSEPTDHDCRVISAEDNVFVIRLFVSDIGCAREQVKPFRLPRRPLS